MDTPTRPECGEPWNVDDGLQCQLEPGHKGMHYSKGTWSTGGEVEVWWMNEMEETHG
jgi:hypothetical protein